jgi:hypothetical protein
LNDTGEVTNHKSVRPLLIGYKCHILDFSKIEAGKLELYIFEKNIIPNFKQVTDLILFNLSQKIN